MATLSRCDRNQILMKPCLIWPISQMEMPLLCTLFLLLPLYVFHSKWNDTNVWFLVQVLFMLITTSDIQDKNRRSRTRRKGSIEDSEKEEKIGKSKNSERNETKKLKKSKNFEKSKHVEQENEGEQDPSLPPPNSVLLKWQKGSLIGKGAFGNVRTLCRQRQWSTYVQSMSHNIISLM